MGERLGRDTHIYNVYLYIMYMEQSTRHSRSRGNSGRVAGGGAMGAVKEQEQGEHICTDQVYID